MRTFLAASCLIALTASGAQSQTYPSRTVSVIVPFAAGGPADITGRVIADIFNRALGQHFVVENVAGAGGTTGAARGARAAPDGYTLTMGHMGTHAAAPAIYPNLSYKPDTDFEPIGLIAEQPEVLVVRKTLPTNSLREFATYAKANEASLNMAHAGIGSVSHVGCLLLNAAIGIKPSMVPFTGTGPATTALIAGQVDYLCDPLLGQLPHIQAGTVKALAIATTKRSKSLPDLPTAAEQGMPQFEAAPFYAAFAPAGTPASIIRPLADSLAKGLDEPAVRSRFETLGADVPEPARRGPAALAALVRSEMARLTPLITGASAKQ